ncbi:Yip1 family protein [Serratia aquatilis]|uniref:Yip1 family protein n=1 Tax=Serratia aquatilis TaxID=1737515 RepID=A0ABV6EKC0_9GAMM
MANHVWGLLAHPSTEFKHIKSENESVSHLYTHHVLLMALIPVICAFIGTTQLGWLSGSGHALRLDMLTAFYTAVAFYLLMLAGVAFMGKVIHFMARRYESRPSLHRCMVFAGYVATPMFLSGLVALYPVLWLCLFVGIIGLVYSGYLLYVGIPHFLNIDSKEGFIFSSWTLAIGVLLLEFLLGLTVVLWGYGSWFF